MKKLLYITVIGLSLCAYSCTNWLDVKPKHMAEEEDLFSREEGFKEALTGIYIKAAKTNLYGTRLSYDYLDKLAQRYMVSDGSLQKEENYDFSADNTDTSDITVAIWNNMYNVIANLNNLIYWVDENSSVLRTPGYYEIIKGEALGMRAYLYFDLLRMFGPIYKEDPTGKSIPYRTQFNRDIKELERADKVLEYIIEDLLEAEKLMEEKDPLDFSIKTSDGYERLGAASDEDGFLIFRFKRMNLMAVKALLARVYLYAGNKTDAGKYANEVIGSGYFSLAKSNTNDRLLSSELIFGVHVDRFEELITNTLAQTSSKHVISNKAFFEDLFNTGEDGLNDFRVGDGAGFYQENNIWRFLKYDQTGLLYGYEATIPMIRLAEMYYIAAECQTNYTLASGLLSDVREARGGDEVEVADAESLLKNLELEYRKEFYGEGQLWYFYKRHFYKTFLHCPINEMRKENYVFSVPTSEFQFGSISDE